MLDSKSAAVLTAEVPTAVIPAVTGSIFFPAFVIVCPVFLTFSPACAILTTAVWEFFACVSRFFNAFSVSTISNCSASYLSFPSSPLASCVLANLSASFKAANFSFVFSIPSCNSSYFCCSRVVFVGSNFKSLLTSRNDVCVLLSDFSTPLNALSSPVVSPPISIVIPLILLLMMPPLFYNASMSC